MTAPNTETDNDSTTTETSTPPAPTSVDTTMATMRAAFFSALAEKDAEIQRLREVSNRPAEPARTPQEKWGGFTEDPEGTISTVVAREVEKQFKPVNDFVAGLKNERALDRLLADLAAQNPRYQKAISKGRSHIEQALAGGTISPQTVFIAVNTVMGMAEAGVIQIPGWSETPTPERKKDVPPRVPTSPPTHSNAQDVEEEKPWENMSENEKKLARLSGLTYEDYWKGQQESILQVRTKKEKK